MSKARRNRPSAIHWGEYQGSTVVYVELNNGEHALVDAEDWPRIKNEYGEVWHANSNGKGSTYARLNLYRPDGSRERVSLQRAVLGAGPGEQIKVLNDNPMDCRKLNLTFMTKAQHQELIRRKAT